ncbi:chemerin-like receptor 1 isoform X2 [Lates calcarifer]|uniref:Chemerin-like receptor 1 isoform X2 n=1 Tax=Lates calcarifer TaxID=8187 RepID=A0AAJ8BF11_LATCA|nr:chemerin-like receptor 1 isoform X2 [Lates calcarifer]
METTTTSFYHNNATSASGQHGPDKYAGLTKSFHTMSAIIYSLAFFLGVLGNGVVILVTGFKMKKTVNTVWFLNLAVADFLFTAFLPFTVTYVALDFHWPFGNIMCKLNTTVTFLNMFASVYILVVISVDRCVSVVWPVWAQNHRNMRRASCVSLGVWDLALIFSAPYFLFRDTGLYHCNESINTICADNFSPSYDNGTPAGQFRHQAVAITRFLLGFVVPFTVIISCYAVIIHRLRRSRTLASQSSGESETLRHVIAISMPVAKSLAFLNSCLNPLLYVFMGQDFKDKIRKSILNILETVFQE